MSGNPFDYETHNKEASMTFNEISVNKEWECILDENFDNGGKFSSFRCNNKQKLLDDTKEFRCFLELILDERNKYEKCLGLLEYKNGYPFVNNREANNYSNYTVENYFFIGKDRDIESTMKLIFNCFGDNLKEEDMVLDILEGENMKLKEEIFKNEVTGKLGDIPIRAIMIKKVGSEIYKLDSYIPTDKYSDFQNIVGKEIDFEIYQHIEKVKIKVIETNKVGGTDDTWDSIWIKFNELN